MRVADITPCNAGSAPAKEKNMNEIVNVETLTVAEARELREKLNTVLGAASDENPLERFVGHNVVVRDNRAGVYWGKCIKVGKTSLVLDTGARQGHYWHAKGACIGLASTGPKATENTRYTSPTPGPIFLCDLVAIIPTSAEADAAWASMPEWKND